VDRRTFVATAMAGAAADAMPARSTTSGIKAIAFDGLALFDPRPIFALAEQFFPGRSASLVATWRGRQFDYTWLRTMIGSYADFLQVTDEALSFAAEAEKISVTAEQRQKLLAGFMNMKAWPDVSHSYSSKKEGPRPCATD
jgi:2-haloacid dehalogenase